MKTYLITGGAGFIGSNFIQYMFRKYDKDIKIINADCLTYAGNLENLKGVEDRRNYIFERVDITNRDDIDTIFSQHEIDCVVHFAAESHVDRSIKSPEAFVKTNVLGTQILLDIAKKYWEDKGEFKEGKKFIQISTDEVYGSLEENGYFTENTPVDPHSPYSASKAAADMLVKAYYDTYKMPVNITRCSNNYGAYQFPEKLIPLMINNALEGEDLPIYGDGKNIRDWLYVDDHCKAIDLVIKQGKIGEVYNIGGHNEKQNIDIVKIIINALRNLLSDDDYRKEHINENLIKYVKDRKGHDRRYAIDPTKIKNQLDWEPETKFEEGINYTIRWYLDNGEWMNNVTSGEYQKYYTEMYVEGV
ncbi:dTDP-glucose 4,6-dehydratase [Anaerovirgula multivorans]|uniref:dTDP-glucose 4,6-dehydratase n=1 Tax=Anaerovirgula multivorans TaxID=312168 RepID=A0A239EIG6_9FIRM|nr:dTDP-glucose 4,6-dehydratase [Anaerovirgula multivorans]SNS43702.1 dTDP-glucose 4,6-dehydratase [Anaerovirgula multivorans]